MKAHGQALRVGDGHGRLPLHYAAAYKAPLKVTRYLAAIYRPALQVPDKDGSLPLHLLAVDSRPLADVRGRDAAPDVVRDLADQFPEAMLQKRAGYFGGGAGEGGGGDGVDDGGLPLHVALARGSLREAPEVVKILVDLCPAEALLERNESGQLPLHVATARDGVPVEVVQFLVKSSSTSASKLFRRRTEGGISPLHLAIRPRTRSGRGGADARGQGVRRSFGSGTAAGSYRCIALPGRGRRRGWSGPSRTGRIRRVRKRDVDGSLPLHSAIRGQAPADVVELLIEK